MVDQQPDAGEDVRSFVKEYRPDDADRIRFAWNGKHAREFIDSNQDFRFRVVDHVCRNPALASTRLLVDLFLESANWACEAWCSPVYFPDLGAVLLVHGGEDVLPEFLSGFNRTFDTFGACHEMKLDPVLVRRLAQVTEERAATAPTAADENLWLAGRELFAKLADGTASQGWAVVAPGTPVTNVRVVPAWRLKVRALWKKVRTVVGPK